MDPHNLYVAAQDQLEAEGVDVYDLRCNESRLLCLRFVDLCFRMRENGSFKNAPEESVRLVILKELQKIEEAETQAIFEEMEAGMRDHADRLYDEMREEGV